MESGITQHVWTPRELLDQKGLLPMEYDVIVYTDLANVIKIVNARIEEGWTPLGGIAVAIEPTVTGGSVHSYYQAIVRGGLSEQ